MADPVVKIDGMAAIRKDLNKLATDVSSPLFKAISAAGKSAVEPVAAATRSRIPSRSGRLAGSVRTSGTRTGGAVRMGSKAVPYAGWMDFGGSRPDGSQREYLQGGRYLFPSAQTLAGVAATHYTAALNSVFARSDIWTNPGGDPASVHD